GGVVDDGHEGLIRPRHQREPLMATAVEVDELAEAGPRLPPPAMTTARPTLSDEPRRLQSELDEGVGECHVVIAPGELVEVTDIEAGVVLPVETQDPLHLGLRRGEVRGAPAAAIEQAEHGIAFIPRAPPAERSRMDPQDVGGLQPR